MRPRRQMANMNKLKHSGLGSTPLRGGVQNPARQIEKGEQKANRESLRLETIATRTKQKPDPSSNREKEPVFYSNFCSPTIAPPSQKGEQKANREPIRLETLVTPRKENTGPISNREKVALFQLTLDPPAHISKRPDPPEKTTKTATRTPPNLFRVRSRPTLYFLRLTRNSTYTHVSGTRTIFRTRMSRLNWAKKETPTNKNPNQRNGQTAAAGTPRRRASREG